MRGPSRAAFRAAREKLAEVVRDSQAAATASEELFGITALLSGEPALRRALTDITRSAQDRSGLIRGLLEGKVSGETLDLVADMVADRWSLPRDLADATGQLAVLATAAWADSEGQLDELEDELFRFGRIAKGEPELLAALDSPVLPADRKRDLLDALLEGKASPATRRLITQAAVQPRGRNLEANLSQYAILAADWRRRVIALVRVATELTRQQRGRLAEALSAMYDRSVHLNVIVDPQVMGGMSIQIGDDLIDGSVATRLAALRRRLAA
jgi:F-type H+-transporting ATPase subunit delta